MKESPGKCDPAAGLHKVVALAAGSGDPEAGRVADALSLWLDGNDSVRLEAALGVAPTWRSAERRRRRDGLYAKLARTTFPHLTGLPLARAVKAEIDRYQTSSWPRDHANGCRPLGQNGLIFDLLTLDERLLDAGTLRKLPGIFNAFENQTSGLRLDEEEGNCREHDGQVFKGSEIG